MHQMLQIVINVCIIGAKFQRTSRELSQEVEEEEEHEFIWLHNKKYTIVVIVQR